MEVLDGRGADLLSALGAVAANPNPEHVREYTVLTGDARPDMARVLADNASRSRIMECALSNGDAVVMGLALRGVERIQVWMAASAGTVLRPRWLMRESARMLARLCRFAGHGVALWQWIPDDYRAGLVFARHFGFVEKGMVFIPESGKNMVVVEKEVSLCRS